MSWNIENIIFSCISQDLLRTHTKFAKKLEKGCANGGIEISPVFLEFVSIGTIKHLFEYIKNKLLLSVPSIPTKCHACGSKTWISRLLTPVFQLVTPGRKVWAITALTDTFYVNKPEPKGEKKSLCRWSTFSEFSFFSRKSMFLCVPVFVLDGTLRNIFGLLRNVFGYYRTPRKILKNVTSINVKRLAGIT